MDRGGGDRRGAGGDVDGGGAVGGAVDGADDGGPSVVAMTACHSWRRNGAAEAAIHSDWGSYGPHRPLGASPYAVADGGA